MLLLGHYSAGNQESCTSLTREKSSMEEHCTSHGRSVMCPDHVQGRAQAEEEEEGGTGGSGLDAS